MIIETFNKSESKYFTFIVKETAASLKKYYRVELGILANLLAVDNIYSNLEIEDLEEYKKIDAKKLVQASERYAYFKSKDVFVYKVMYEFIADEIIFEGYTTFPTGVYKAGGGFTEFSLTNSLKNGIEYFCGEENLKLKKFCISKTNETKVKTFKGKVIEVTLSEKDFKKNVQFSQYGKNTGKVLANNTIAEFFHNKFPKASKFNPDKQESNLKKMFLATLDTSLLGKFTQEELEQVEVFFQTMLDKNIKKQGFIKRNYLKIKQINLEEILREMQANLSKKTKESTWQQFFEKNIFIFDSRYIDFISKYNLKCGRKSEPDFLVHDIYGMIDIYEIKLPTAQLLTYDESHDNYFWSSDISKAISQLEKYIYLATENKLSIESDIKKKKNRTVTIIKPKGVLVIGSRKELDSSKKIEDFNILRASLKNIELVLYDEIYDSLNNLKNVNL